MLVVPYYDVFQYQYSVLSRLVEPFCTKRSRLRTFTEIYAPCRPSRYRAPRDHPVFQVRLGKLIYGVSDPNSPAFNTLADFYAGNGVGGTADSLLLFNVRARAQRTSSRLERDRAISGQTVDPFLWCFLQSEHGHVPFGMNRGTVGICDFS